MGYFYEMDGLPLPKDSPHPDYCTCLFCANGRPTESFIEWQRRLSDADQR